MKRTATAGLILFCGAALAAPASATRVAVVFEGGHETDPRDRGRPVALIAGALGVTEAAFRDAFSRVRPAQDGRPSEDEQRRNKAALLGALAKYGVTNERLDEVSDHYRYRREAGESWPARPAKAFAVVEKGRIVRFEVTDPGEGYSSPPRVRVPGYGRAKARLALDQSFEKNGSIASIG